MDVIKITEFALGGIASLGVFSFGIGYVLSQYGQGRSTQKNDVVKSGNELNDYLVKQIEGFRERNAEMQADFSAKAIEMQKDFTSKIKLISDELNQVKGELVATRKQRDDILMVLQNRNPEMTAFMEHLLKATADQDKYRKDMLQIVQSIIPKVDQILTNTDSLSGKIDEVNDKELKIEAKVTNK